jgi:hypothetical protein
MLDGKIYTKGSGIFELDDAKAANLVRDGKIAPVSQVLTPSLADEMVTKLEAEVQGLNGTISSKEAEIAKMTELLAQKEADIIRLTKGKGK